MGVTGLWTVLQPCARPIKIETLNKKRLAVDASIWIYQFLKAVRDKEGNALRNAHVVGFFRRICKLLFYGIRPVFVFDGGAPLLKRQTIASRKGRREGRREDAVRTAGKLLAVQMARRAEEEERKRKEEERAAWERRGLDEEEPVPENLVYAAEVHMTPQERQKTRTKFKKTDQYHLPELEVSLSEMGGPDDPRVMSLEELQAYARQFDTGEDINVYDFSKIDFDSPFFLSLPASDRYNILNAARLRSRLRMGLSKEQLDRMFPDRMAFSKFQIDRVRERNELTQRLMNINGMVDDVALGIASGAGRVSGEKGREYVLVKNDGVEGGWALGVVSSKDEGQEHRPIDVDKLDEIKRRRQEVENDDEWEDDGDDFEDVPIEGLNRMPKRGAVSKGNAIYKSRKQQNKATRPGTREPDSLFISDEDERDGWEDVSMQSHDDLFEEPTRQDSEEENLQRAIAMSLQQDGDANQPPPQTFSEEDDDYLEVFQQTKAAEAAPFTKGSGLAIARMANNRSSRAAPASKVKPGPFSDSDDEDMMDLQAALAESRKSKRRPSSPKPDLNQRSITQSTTASGLAGPLPFERLDLGKSILGRKKKQKPEVEGAGGFVREEDRPKEKKEEPPLPPWFAGGDVVKDTIAQRAVEEEARATERRDLDGFEFQEPGQSLLQRKRLDEIIDVDALGNEKSKEVVEIDSQEGDRGRYGEEMEIMDSKLRMGDTMRTDPPGPPPEAERVEKARLEDKPPEWDESDKEDNIASLVQEELHIAPVTQPVAARVPSPEEEQEFEDVPMTTDAHTTGEAPPEVIEEFEGHQAIPMTGAADQDTLTIEDYDEGFDYYSDPEELELMRQLATEAEEHARFASTLNNKTQEQNVRDYETELKSLREQQKKDRRDADEVTQTMVTECQELLSLFGLPYITAPMEAEAQCAELAHLGLVDGIVTDDSDAMLFGATRVYKNLFNAAKFVECYLSSDLESELGLTRQRLVALAQLLGSDYAQGLPGVGPVTAIELLAEFDGLEAFTEWWADVQNGTRPVAEDRRVPVRRKFRKAQATKLFLPHGFPDPRVDEAYLNPEVDDSKESFVWGVPDLDALRRFLMATVGWSAERTDEVLVPVIRDMNRRELEGTQSNITHFFSGTVGAGA
ncbi:hypothetical protein BDY21DRAFT_267496, partial [Lineolata rhizophorae]